jgi:hypothetical protein
MALTIQIPAQAEARLAEKARKVGVDVPTYIERLIEADASRPPLDVLLKPVHEAFRNSGMSEEELGAILVKAKKEMRVERRQRKAS